MPLTLKMFLDSGQTNCYVKERIGGITYTIYLRQGRRLIDGQIFDKVLDLANIT